MQLIGQGTKTVTTAGTAVALGSGGTNCQLVMITAYGSNTGTIYIGTSTVSASEKSGTPLAAGTTGSFPVGDLDDIYVDSTASGDIVSYTYYIN